VGQRCRRFRDVPAYHDHNWGVWRDVTWEWGAAQGSRLAVLYGGVYGPERSNAADVPSARSPFFLTVVDSLGVQQVLRFDRINYEGALRGRSTGPLASPRRFDLTATRDGDTLQLGVEVRDALGTEMYTSGFRRGFLQMRGRFSLRGMLLGETVSDSGMGFFETYLAGGRRR
jgi:hypothetical protein